MENNPLTEEKAIPRPELGCGSAYDCFYRLDVISAKRLLKQEHFIYFDDGTCAECHKECNILIASNYLCKDCWIDACFRIADGKEGDKE
jgi:hypothetical protein